MLQRLARSCYRHRWPVLGGWAVLLVGLFALNTAFGGQFLDEFDLPGSESQQAYDMLDEHGFEARTGFSGQIVFTADDVRDPAVQRGMEELFAEVERLFAPGEVVSPYGPGGERFVGAEGTI